MMTATDHRSLLLGVRAEILKRLIELAPAERRDEAERLVAELEDNSALLRLLESRPTHGQFSGYREPIDAIVALLTMKNAALSKEQIIDSLAQGGFRGGVGIASVVKASLSYWSKPGRDAEKQLKNVDERIGLAFWPDMMFKTK